MEKINKLIQLVKKQIIEIETIKQNNNEDFNIFSILKMERKEVETHSAFIYELLNPYGSHNQKDLFLKLFIEKVLNIKNYGQIIKVTREDPTIENRRIDFVIETQKELIGIEMKIDAGDQYEQLLSYKKELKLRRNNNQNMNLYYLTLFGDSASYESTKTLKVNQDYKIISFYNSIYEWLSLCIKHTNKLITLNEAIVQYRNLINILTKKENKKMENFIDEISKDVNDIKSMNAISENYPLIWAKKEIEFWNRIENNLENRLDNNYSILYLLVFCNKDNRPNYVKLNSIRTKAGKERKPFGIYIQKDIENTNYHLDISAEYNEFGYNNQKEKGIKINLTVEHNKSGNIRDNSEIREVVNIISIPINTNINFYHYKNNDMLTFDLFEEDFFDKITEELTEEILNYIFTIEKYEEKIYQSIK